ncbi:MAG: hypothetical protein CMD20_01230 [Flavobacteriales bacterium]|jgi:hypothetical protein|nr:hypothetical protein [Flavobacteriales bacterium]
MLDYLKQRIFPSLIALSALAVSGSAAFYSVSGLSKLFAGATLAVIIMAASLEIAKLVIASLLYQYRKTLPKLLKFYLTTACVVLIFITSMGIYGFLSAAYQETAALAGNIDAQIALIEVKRDNVKEQLFVYNEEKSSINESVTSLRNGLSNNVIQYTDTLGNVITTTSSSTRRALEKQLDQAIERQTTINAKVDELNQQLFNYETEIVEVSTSSNISGELGPLKYLSGLTGLPMDRIINILLLVIIFVFDPLAIALVIAANFAFAQLVPRGKYKEILKITRKLPKNKEKEFEELKKRVEKNQEKINKDWEDREERMNIVGQNGNDGIHYEKEDDVKMSVPEGLEFNKPYTMEEVSEAFAKQDTKEEEAEHNRKMLDEEIQNLGEDNIDPMNEPAFTEGYVEDSPPESKEFVPLGEEKMKLYKIYKDWVHDMDGNKDGIIDIDEKLKFLRGQINNDRYSKKLPNVTIQMLEDEIKRLMLIKQRGGEDEDLIIRY